MYNSKHLHYETLFEHWAEEALANKISLRYLFVASKLLGMPELFIHAKEMVEKQDEKYRLGLWAFENNALDWQTLRDNKTNIDEETGDLWVDAVCEDEKVFLDIQKLFYGTFIVGSRPSVSVAPTTTERFYFEDESRIEKTRVYFSTCKIKTDPGFQHCYPDSTRIEIELTFKDKVGNVLCSGPASFYAGTQNLFIKGQLLKDYRNHYGLVKGIRFAFRELKPADGTHNAEWVASEI